MKVKEGGEELCVAMLLIVAYSRMYWRLLDLGEH